jgi:hypothetical protein
LTLAVTSDRINFNVKNTKYPAAIAAAIGKPTSVTKNKKSIIATFCLTLLGIYVKVPK